MWQLMHGKIPVKKYLLDLNLLDSQEAKCSLCGKEEESCRHLFFHCHYTWNIWMEICKSWGVVWVLPEDQHSILMSWNDLWEDTRRLEMWKMLFFVVCWTIWLGRNEIVFEKVKAEDFKWKDLISLRLTSWMEARRPMEETDIDPNNSSNGNRKKDLSNQGWTCPEFGYLKFNVDGASDRSNGDSGIGGVLRDHMGHKKVIFSESVSVKEPSMAEYLAICKAFSIYAISKWNEMGCGLIIETDSVIANKWTLDPAKTHWKLTGDANDLEKNKGKVKKWRIDKIGRSGNDSADTLAKAGIRRHSKLLVVED